MQLVPCGNHHFIYLFIFLMNKQNKYIINKKKPVGHPNSKQDIQKRGQS